MPRLPDSEKGKTGARVRLRRRQAPVGRQGSVLPVERFHALCCRDVRTLLISSNPVFAVPEPGELVIPYSLYCLA